MKHDICKRKRKRRKIVVESKRKRRKKRVESGKGRKNIIYNLPRSFVKRIKEYVFI